ncbi:MAG: NADH-quinone oxidoreductase subunit L, partial [Acidimicrobiales bacterium]
VVLAALAVVGGAINLPFTHDTKILENWLHPVVDTFEAEIDVATATKVALAIGATVASLVGIGFAVLVYVRKRIPADAIERDVLAHAWYYDESISEFMDGAGRTAFEVTRAFDEKVVDGAVNGTGALVRFGASKLRLLQSGYVRNYALGLALGAVVLVGLLVTQAG